MTFILCIWIVCLYRTDGIIKNKKISNSNIASTVIIIHIFFYYSYYSSTYYHDYLHCTSGLEAHTSPISIQDPCCNLSCSVPHGYSAWLALSSRCHYPMESQGLRSQICSCAAQPETEGQTRVRLRKGVGRWTTMKNLRIVSGSLSFIYMHRIWYNQDRMWN